MSEQINVLIRVRNGCAEAVAATGNVAVHIVDHDSVETYDQEPSHCTPAQFAAILKAEMEG